MTLLKQLGEQLQERYYLGLDIGYNEHVAVVISLEMFLKGDGQWKRAECVHIPTTTAGLNKLQRYLNGFSSAPINFWGFVSRLADITEQQYINICWIRHIRLDGWIM